MPYARLSNTHPTDYYYYYHHHYHAHEKTRTRLHAYAYACACECNRHTCAHARAHAYTHSHMLTHRIGEWSIVGDSGSARGRRASDVFWEGEGGDEGEGEGR